MNIAEGIPIMKACTGDDTDSEAMDLANIAETAQLNELPVFVDWPSASRLASNSKSPL
jgi:hypothetical protein